MAPTDRDESTSLGEELFTKKATALEAFFGLKLLLIGIAGSVFLLGGIGPFASYSITVRIVLGGLAVLIAFLGGAFLSQTRNSYHFYSNGVKWGKQSMTFDEIESFRCTLKPPPPRHSHLPTAIEVIYTPYPETGKKPLRYNCGGNTEFIENYLRCLDLLTDKIAARIGQQLKTNGRYQWLPNVAITTKGIESIPKDGFPETRDYESIRLGENGELELAKPNVLYDLRSDEVFLKLPVGTPNILPCWQYLGSQTEVAAFD